MTGRQVFFTILGIIVAIIIFFLLIMLTFQPAAKHAAPSTSRLPAVSAHL